MTDNQFAIIKNDLLNYFGKEVLKINNEINFWRKSGYLENAAFATTKLSQTLKIKNAIYKTFKTEDESQIKKG